MPFQQYLSSLPLIYWQNSEDTLSTLDCSLSLLLAGQEQVGRRPQWLTSFHILLQLLPRYVQLQPLPTSLLFLLQLRQQWLRFGRWQGGSTAKKNQDFHHPLTPTGLNQGGPIRCFSTSLPGWDKTSTMKTNIYKCSAQLLANWCKMDISFWYWISVSVETLSMKSQIFNSWLRKIEFLFLLT